MKRSNTRTGQGQRTPRGFSASNRSSNAISRKSTATREVEELEKDETAAELEKLRQQLNVEMRRNTMLDSELRLALTAAQKAEEAHQRELQTSEADVKRLISERRSLMAKSADVEVVEGSVRELYVQMKDRLTEDAPRPSPEQLKAEKASLEREPILAIVGALRARLEGLWTFKVEAEDDLRASRMAQQQRASAEVAELKAEMRSLENELRQSRKELAASMAETEAAKEALATLAKEAHAMTEEMSAQHAELLSALRASVREGGIAQRQAAAAFSEGKARDSLVLANRQLESARHFDRVTQDKELRRLQHDHEVEMGGMAHELGGLSYQMLTNSQLKEQLQEARNTIAQLRREAQQPSELKGLQHKVRHLEQELKSTRDHLAKALNQLTSPRPHTSGSRTHANSPWCSMDGPLTASPPIRPGSAAVARAKPGQLTGRANESMTRSAHAIMNGARVAAAKARQQAEEQVDDPLFHVIANVGAMNQAAKGALRDVRHEVENLGCSGEPATEQASHPQATATLEAALQPGVNVLGAAGTNNKKPVKHKPVAV